MLMAKIIVEINCDESKLTVEQRKQAFISNTDLKTDHPVALGCEKLVEAIETPAEDCFDYLGIGKLAVTVNVEE